MKKIVVVVPAYNEEKTISETVSNINTVRDDLQALGLDLHIFVVNDGSKDETASVLDTLDVQKILVHKKNRGLGAAVRTGLAAARKAGADLVVKFDADLQHDPKDIVRVTEPILDDRADIVYGNRFEKISYSMPLVRKLGNRVFTGLMCWLTGWQLKDSQPGIFCVNSDFLRDFYLPGNYNYTQQILLDACHRGMRFEHVCVSFNKRGGGESFVSLRYPLKVLPQIIQVLVGVNPLKIFGPVGLLFLVLGGLVFGYDLLFYIFGDNPKPVMRVNFVLGTALFGLQTLFFGFLADLIVRMNRRLTNSLRGSGSDDD